MLSGIFSICILMLMFTPVYSLQTKLQQIKNQGYITVAIPDKSYPPFIVYLEDGHFEGSDIWLINKISKYLNVTVKYLSYATANAQIEAVANSKVDIAIGGLSATLKRSKKVNFSIPYAKLNLVLLVSRFSDLTPQSNFGRNTSIGVLADSSFVEYAEQKFSNANIKPYRSSQSMLVAVKEKKVDAALSDINKARNLLNSDPADGMYIRIMVIPNFSDLIAIAANYDAPDLTQSLNTVIKKLRLSE